MGEVVRLAAVNRDHRISIRLSAEEAGRLERYAASRGLAVASAVRFGLMRLLDDEERYAAAAEAGRVRAEQTTRMIEDDLATSLANIVGMQGRSS